MPKAAAAKAAFERLDKDKSGSLDREEVAALASELGKPLGRADLDLAMKQLDKDGNGKVEFPEFKEFWAEKFSGKGTAGSKLAAIMAQWSDIQPIDGVAYHPDRYVDEDDEFRARVWFTFDLIDTNNDHRISYIEFINWWKRQDKAAHGGTMMLSDDVLCTSRQKFAEFAVANGTSIDRDELAGLLKALQLQKYIASAAAIELHQEPAPAEETKLPSKKSAAESSAAPAAVNGETPEADAGVEEQDDEDAIVEGPIFARVDKNMIAALAKGATEAVLPPGVELGSGSKWEKKEAKLTKNGLSWPQGGKVISPVKLEDIKRCSACTVDKQKFGIKITLQKSDPRKELVFAVEDQDERDEWVDSVNMVIMQELNRPTKKQARAAERAKKAEQREKTVTDTVAEQLKAQVAKADTQEVQGVAYHPDRYVDPDEEFRARVWYLFDQIDANHDDCISYIEFISWWKRRDKHVHHGRATLSDNMLSSSQQTFTEYDTNGSGSIDRDELAGLLRALELADLVPGIDEIANKDAYTVHVHTAAGPDAGTDSKVSLTLFGEQGDSGTKVLTTARNKVFERGQISTFVIDSPDLGTLTKVRIGHDDSGTPGGRPGAGWHLDQVVVARQGTVTTKFPADRWLDSTQGDKQTTVELVPGKGTKKKDRKSKNDKKVSYVNPIYGPSERTKAKPEPEEEAPLDGEPESMDRIVTVISAHDLINADVLDKSDPYCVLTWNGKQVGKTSVVDNTCFPRWNESFTIALPESREGLLKIELFDEDTFGKDDPLGTVEIKLGGKSNPEAIRAQADYSFPDERYTGHVTLQIDKAGRFGSEESVAFKDKWMQGLTYREHREKHVFEQWTRVYLLMATGILALLALAIMILSFLMADCDEEPYLAAAYKILSIVTLLGCSLGFAGALRVKKDVEAEIAKSKGDFTETDDGNDDGLQTVGQRMLEGYNMVIVLMVVIWTVLIAETYVRLSIVDEYAAGNVLHTYSSVDQEDACELQSGTLKNLAWVGIIAIVMLLFSSWCCVKIVSAFEIMQSLGECLSVFLLLCGLAVMFVASFVVKQMVCLNNPREPGEWPADAYWFFAFGMWGFVITAMSFLGFAAAYQESMRNLLIHALSMIGVGLFGGGLMIMIWSSGTEAFIAKGSKLCLPMLNAVTEDVFDDVFRCTKYYGPGLAQNATGGWDLTMRPSKNPMCTPKDLTTHYWEGDAGEYGCINEDCCDEVVNYLQSYEASIYVLSAWLLIIIFGSAAVSMFLRKETSMVGHVMIHPHAKRAFWIMKIAMLAFIIACPFIFSGGSCLESTTVQSMNIASTKQVVNMTAVAPSSCVDGARNGVETDIDCGGSDCGPCLLGGNCTVTGDCVQGTDCDLDTATCAVLSGCSDNQTGGQETCRDGGGPVCRAERQLCAAGLGCQSDSDCDAHLTCGVTIGSPICFSCFDNVTNGDESDTDCGGSCAVCADGDTCRVDSDCRSGSCYNSTCISHLNGKKDGPETDIDCGGGAYPCGFGQACIVGSDCASVTCNVSSQCDVPPLTCRVDGTKNDLETCADGGGAVCRSQGFLCQGNETCNVDDDCVHRCFDGRCVSCSDNVRNGDEIDVDCGGAFCNACPAGSICLADADCEDGLCFNITFAPPPCTDVSNPHLTLPHSCRNHPAQDCALLALSA